ncbi:CHAT domain-containing protein [Nocardia sp. NPDC059240]|uniref:CHAT domain-containing protein n=1 Tax=Nocardia sp. NPDC059240 TaxID=3346786 RepID=UPI0036A2BF2D
MYDESDDLDALRQAVLITQQELASLRDNEPGLSGYLTIAAMALKRLADRDGNLEATREVIRLGRAAVAVVGDDDTARAVALISHGQALRDLHLATGELAAIEEAVKVAREVVELVPADDPDYCGLLHDAGEYLTMLYGRTDEPRHLIEALDRKRASVAACPPGHSGIGYLQASLSITLARSFDRTGNRAEILEAVRLCRRAIAVGSRDHPIKRANELSVLASHLHTLFNATEDITVIDECLRHRRKAIALTPRGHGTRAERETVLGGELITWSMLDGDRKRLNEAVTVLSTASASANAPIAVRISATRLLSHAHGLSGRREKALAAMESVVDVLPSLSPRALTHVDREFGLGRHAGLAAQAAAAAVAARRPRRAVELLEQCRGILLGEAMEDRRDMTELDAVAPELASELTELRNQLTALEDAVRRDPRLVYADPDSPAVVEVGERRRASADRWTALVEQVRGLPGFEGFLRVPDFDVLRRHVVGGPLVMVFVEMPPSGGYALIVPDNPDIEIRVVSLPKLTIAGRTEQLQRLDQIMDGQRGSFADRARSEQELHKLLEWLWDTITGPVLAKLGIGVPSEDPPRVWWCPIGDLALLPIQSAGHHRRPGGRTVLDRTASSIITSLRALGHSAESPARSNGSALLVAMPETPGVPPLCGADREIANIAAVLHDSQILRGSAATEASVTESLARHSIAHFACHAIADPDAPSTSRLLFHDYETNPFTIGTLLRLRLDNADLAYLSACSTTHTTRLLADEAIHLTAAVHLAGYRHVIGTLWAINDAAAGAIAADFYRGLTDNGHHPPRTHLSAQALNKAIRLERARHPTNPTRWAAHLHHGI